MTSLPSFYLIDAHAYLHRAYHALPPLTNSKGEPVQALFGFARMVLKILRQEKPNNVAVCFDTPAPTFRHRAYEAYKATRKKAEDGLIFQLPLARDLVAAWGLPMVALDGFEADDLIATLAQRGEKEGFRVVVVTGDKDALQLVGPKISVLNEFRGVLYTEKEVEEKYGLRPGQLVDFFALTGDASDNVPGVSGVGEKTAVDLLKTHGTLDNIYAHLSEVKESVRKKLEANRDMAYLSHRLVTLAREVPLPLGPRDCVVQEAPAEPLIKLLTRLEFPSLLNELSPRSKRQSAREVRTVQSAADFESLAKDMAQAKELAVDVETTGLDSLRCGLVGIALSTSPGAAWYIPVGHDELGKDQRALLARSQEVLGPHLKNKNLPKLGHNLKFDLQVLRRFGLPLEGIDFDTLLASYRLDPSRGSHGLKDLARDLLGEDMTPLADLIGQGAKQVSMATVPVERAAPYAGADAEVTLRLKHHFAPLLEKQGLERLFREVEMPLLLVLADMEARGIRVDVPTLLSLQEDFDRDIKGLLTNIREQAGEDINVNSPKQLSVLLFEKLHLPVIRRTKTGFSTDEDVLEKLSTLHPLPAKILEYRELAKLKSTYVDALLELKDEKTSRIHTRLNQAVAATGRLSSSDPNLQNIPIRTEHGRRIRKAFIPEPGWLFLSADYSQIDLRVLAHISGDPALREAFHKGQDVHASTARDIFGLEDAEEVTEDQRRIAKTVNFGIVYGQTAYGLSQQMGLTLEEARTYIEKYFVRYGGVKKWMEKCLEEARERGCVFTLLGRLRQLPEINSKNGAVRGFAERTAINTPIQGTSADIMKLAMNDLVGWLQSSRHKARLLLQVHDDLLFEIPPEEKELAGEIKKRMENALALEVPLVVDVKLGSNWLDMKRWQ